MKFRSIALALTLISYSTAVRSQTVITWVWEDPYPVGAQLNAVWGSGPNDVYVAGENAALAHFDGSAWTPIETGIDDSFAGIIGFPDGQIFLTGDDNHEIGTFQSGVTHRLNGDRLELVPMEFSGGRPNRGIWGTSSSDFVIAVDGCPQFYDGVDFAPDCTIPVLNGSFEQFSVHGFGIDDLYFGQINQLTHLDRMTGAYAGYPVNGTVHGLWVAPDGTAFAGTHRKELVTLSDQGIEGPWTLPTNDRDGIQGLWGTTSNDVWTVGERIYRFDGATFTEMPRPDSTRSLLRDVWGVGGDDVYAVGDAGTILHYDGASWQRLAGAQTYAANNSGAGWSSLHGTRRDNLMVGGEDVFVRGAGGWEALERFDMAGNVRGIFAASNTSVWAVGDRIWHWDGNPQGDWSEQENPLSVDLNRAHGIAADDFYVAADDANLLHYDGSAFRAVALPDIAGADLNDVWVAAADRVFVVGDNATILLFDGANWGVHGIPNLPSSGDSIMALWGDVVDETIDVYAATSSGEILHWPGGSNWDVVETGLPASSRSYTGLWGVRTDTTFDLFAVGKRNFFNGGALVVHQRNGVFSESEFTDHVEFFTDVVGTSPNDVAVVGGRDGLIYRFDGSTWNKVEFPGGRVAQVRLQGLDALPGGHLVAGGFNYFLHRDAQWQLMARPLANIGDFRNVLRAPDGEIYVTGQRQSFSAWDTLHHNGMTYQPLGYRHLENSSRCLDFWTDGMEFFVLCNRDDNTVLSTVHHYDGAVWSTMDFPEQRGMAIWGADVNNVFVVGDVFLQGGAIAYFDGNGGGTWAVMPTDTPSPLLAVHGFAANDVFAVGEDASILHYDGEAWAPSPTPLPTNTFLNLNVRSVHADAHSGIAVAGVSGRRSLLWQNGQWSEFNTLKSGAAIRGVWTDGGAVFLATSYGEILRGDLRVVFYDGFESQSQSGF